MWKLIVDRVMDILNVGTMIKTPLRVSSSFTVDAEVTITGLRPKKNAQVHVMPNVSIF